MFSSGLEPLSHSSRCRGAAATNHRRRRSDRAFGLVVTLTTPTVRSSQILPMGSICRSRGPRSRRQTSTAEGTVQERNRVRIITRRRGQDGNT